MYGHKILSLQISKQQTHSECTTEQIQLCANDLDFKMLVDTIYGTVATQMLRAEFGKACGCCDVQQRSAALAMFKTMTLTHLLRIMHNISECLWPSSCHGVSVPGLWQSTRKIWLHPRHRFKINDVHVLGHRPSHTKTGIESPNGLQMCPIDRKCCSNLSNSQIQNWPLP